MVRAPLEERFFSSPSHTERNVRAIIQRYVDVGVDEIIIPDFNLGRTAADKEVSADRFMTEVGAAFQ